MLTPTLFRLQQEGFDFTNYTADVYKRQAVRRDDKLIGCDRFAHHRTARDQQHVFPAVTAAGRDHVRRLDADRHQDVGRRIDAVAADRHVFMLSLIHI